MLMRQPTMLARATGDDRPCFTLGDHFGSMVLGWPAAEVPACEGWFQLKPNIDPSELRWLVVDSLDAWEVAEIRWHAPASLQVFGLSQSIGTAAQCMGWEPLKIYSCRMAFGKLERHQLIALAPIEQMLLLKGAHQSSSLS